MPPLSLHATAVAVEGAALLLLGPSGAGKSSVAAGMVALGAGLVSDDLCLLTVEGEALAVAAPPGAAPLLEARGIGPLPVRPAGPARVAGALRLEAAPARLPEPETIAPGGIAVPLLRHPPTPDLPPKLLLWLRARLRDPRWPPGAPPFPAGPGHPSSAP